MRHVLGPVRRSPVSTDNPIRKTALTGIKPTDAPHIGNYLGAIRPAVALAESYRTLYFIADYHAITTERDPARLRTSIYDVAATWIASGLDPSHTILYRQSAVPEVFELAWIFSCLLATGQLERGHAYKDAVSRGESPNAGIFNYPVLMAADIVLYDAEVVPVGKDQVQHVELCRDVALRLNHVYGEGAVVVPDVVPSSAPLIPGTDGEKMSKSRGNHVPLFAPAKDLKKAIMGIKTGSEPLEAPKPADGTTVFEIFRAFASPAEVASMREDLQRGGYGWGHAKDRLYQALEAEIGPKREVYEALRADEGKLDEVLAEGAERARVIAKRTMRRVREAVGIDKREPRREKLTLPARGRG